jgi:hypothetical protein
MLAVVHHLIGAAEIGELFNVSRQRVQQLVNRPDFPRPVVELAMGKVWKTEDVLRWGRENGRIADDVES